MEATIGWNGTRWHVAEGGSALDPAIFECPRDAWEPVEMVPGASLEVRRGWNGTFRAYPCGVDVSPCGEAAWHDAPPGAYVVRALAVDADGRARK